MLSAGAWSKGPRACWWVWTDPSRIGRPGWRLALLAREWLVPNERGERAHNVVFAPERTTLRDVVRVAIAQWTIEDGFEAAKQEVGLDEYGVRMHDEQYQYITFALFADAFLAPVRAHAARRTERSRRARPARSARQSARPPSSR